jgi:hypothetical protein
MIYCQEYGIVTDCGGDTIRVCLFCLSTEFGVDESALFVRLRGVFTSPPITLRDCIVLQQYDVMIYCQEYGIVTGCKTNSRSCKIEQSKR